MKDLEKIALLAAVIGAGYYAFIGQRMPAAPIQSAGQHSIDLGADDAPEYLTYNIPSTLLNPQPATPVPSPQNASNFMDAPTNGSPVSDMYNGVNL